MDAMKVRDHPNLVRDRQSKAILNVDHAGLDKYRRERDIVTRLTRENEQLRREFDTMKDSLARIEKLLTDQRRE